MGTIGREKVKGKFLNVYRDKEGKKIFSNEWTKENNLTVFKQTIKSGTYIFGDEYTGSGTVKVGKEILELETDNFIKPARKIRAFRVVGFYKKYHASSSLFVTFKEAEVEEAKEIAIFNIATQIISEERGFLAGEYDFDFIEENESVIEDMAINIRTSVSFKYIFSKEKS